MPVRTSKDLNKVVEQDHRTVKRPCASMAEFKSLACAANTIAGIKRADCNRKRQL